MVFCNRLSISRENQDKNHFSSPSLSPTLSPSLLLTHFVSMYLVFLFRSLLLCFASCLLLIAEIENSCVTNFDHRRFFSNLKLEKILQTAAA
jgi:hypothetical protein